MSGEGCFPEKAHHLYCQRLHKQKGELILEDLIPGIRRHLLEVIKNAAGGP